MVLAKRPRQITVLMIRTWFIQETRGKATSLIEILCLPIKWFSWKLFNDFTSCTLHQIAQLSLRCFRYKNIQAIFRRLWNLKIPLITLACVECALLHVHMYFLHLYSSFLFKAIYDDICCLPQKTKLEKYIIYISFPL